MTSKTSFLKANSIAFIIPITLILALIFLLNSTAFTNNQNILSTFITIDFIITIPLVYFLIVRKTKISNLTIAPFLIICVIIASYVIPAANQETLSIAKTWLIPIVELSVLSIIILKVRKAIQHYKKVANNHQDFYSILQDTCKSIFPEVPAKLAANEIALIYYGFFNLKKTNLKSNEYTNYKGSGILSTLVAVIFLVAIEMVTIHLLAVKWNTTFAWILTGLSIYSALQIIGIIRSVPKRPIAINDNELILRFGILSETIIPIEDIETIALADSSDFDKEKSTKTLSLLGELENSNVVIQLKTPQHLHFIYGKSKTYTKLLFFVDDNQSFKIKVEKLLSR
ncbi:hypothetical protein [Psychroserpens ponticola]|uniref:Beta-carotene 15,15'-monooxygenase n=1 Tax=Psychroserpens ponticola TaxID=2932268 RepID=A0ABY7RYE0_9FLAO|nr:hypothetical protein [Psychroserpens ponticola]WCO00720.1 hypothetical protein MUN68_011650 [Psychroserpens ponticola]